VIGFVRRFSTPGIRARSFRFDSHLLILSPKKPPFGVAFLLKRPMGVLSVRQLPVGSLQAAFTRSRHILCLSTPGIRARSFRFDSHLLILSPKKPPFGVAFLLKRPMGVEPTSQAWEAWVMPLYDGRMNVSWNQSNSYKPTSRLLPCQR
jgi:predicted GNAT superfamily acetyltransferase